VLGCIAPPDTGGLFCRAWRVPRKFHSTTSPRNTSQNFGSIMIRLIARAALLMIAIAAVLLFAASRHDLPTPAAASPDPEPALKKSDRLPTNDFRDRFIAPPISTIRAETIPEHKTKPTTRQKPKDVCQRHGMTKRKHGRRGWRCRR
jgi:hypothetical protein